MANKRMFTMKIVDSDAFLDMPLSTQCLYFHLCMRADDDGFIGNPKRVMKVVGSNDDDLKLLIAKRFLLTFDGGVIVIKHWRMHNYIDKNRYNETPYTDEKSQLLIKKNKSYSFTSGVPIEDKQPKPEPQEVYEDEVEEENEPATGRYSSDFEAFWSVYPRKADKGQAYKKYQARLKSGYSPEELEKAAKNYRDECIRQKTEQKYIKHAKTFLGDATPFVDYLLDSSCSVMSDTSTADEADFGRYL